MKKVIVIGCPGSGKSTFARKLRDKTALPLFYLDRIWHKPDKTTVTREEFDKALGEIIRQERWIIDGNYGRTLNMRLDACDTVFLFDLPLDVCLAGAASRINTVREDLPWVETEFDPEFRKWIEDFPTDSLPKIYEKLKPYSDTKRIVIFRSRKEADAFLEEAETKGESNE